jgi:hypothetical protein
MFESPKTGLSNIFELNLVKFLGGSILSMEGVLEANYLIRYFDILPTILLLVHKLVSNINIDS